MFLSKMFEKWHKLVRSKKIFFLKQILHPIANSGMKLTKLQKKSKINKNPKKMKDFLD